MGLAPTPSSRPRARPAITLIANSQYWGGAEVFTVRLAEALGDRADVVVAAASGSPVAEAARAAGLAGAPLDLGPKLSRRTAVRKALSARRDGRALAGLLAGRPTDGWVVAQFKWEQVLLGGMRRWPFGRLAVIEHGPIPPALLATPVARRRLLRTLTQASAVFAVGEPLQRDLAALLHRPVVLLPGGVDEARAAAAPLEGERLRREHAPAARHVLAYVGRVEREKGVLRVVDALAHLPDAVLLIAGDGGAREEVVRRARAAGVADRVRLLGWLEDPYPVYAAADLVVLLSEREGSSLMAREAAAVGTPTFAAPLDALVALSREPLAPTVFFASGGAPHELADEMARCLSQPPPSPVVASWRRTAEIFLTELGAAS